MPTSPPFPLKSVLTSAVMTALGLALFAPATTTTASATIALGQNPRYVAAPSGNYRGIELRTIREFLGIRYAQPPVGALRWEPPQTAGLPGGLHNATRFGKHCAQNAGAFGQASTSEDCLFLNVFTPPDATNASHLPVMVWIHGGAFTTGESDNYNPDRLVPHGVVVVTLNYRLGLLGFFAQPALDGEGHPAVNYGLMDQQAALQWVKRNIAAFGGDPRLTTIFGESAGGLSVYSQLSSPGARDLFSAAIDESGSYQLTLPSLAASETAGEATAVALGCPSQTAACLRAVPVSTILATEGPMTVPTVDGTVLPRSPSTAFATGQFHRVPIAAGTNHDEYRLFVAADFDLGPNGPITPAEYPQLIIASLGQTAGQAVLQEYPLQNYPSPDLAFATLVTDYIFSCPALESDLAIQRFAPLYAYEFADENAPEPYLPPVSFPYAAAHASELQFLWDRFVGSNPQLSPAEITLAQTMTTYWTEFATTHQPSVPGLPLWSPFAPTPEDIESLVPPTPGVTHGFAVDHKCAFWSQLEGGQQQQPSMQRIHDAERRLGLVR